jgi:large subunit ribosomal protein L15
MKYNELKTLAYKDRKRVGRGIAAGQGKTAGRGTKGQMSRTGKGKRPGFEGGQNPLAQRVPKLRGFKSYKTSPENVYTGQLDALGVVVDNQALATAQLISNPHVSVKLIVKGEVSKKHTVKLQAASVAAISAVEAAGGSFERVERVARPVKKSAKDNK